MEFGYIFCDDGHTVSSIVRLRNLLFCGAGQYHKPAGSAPEEDDSSLQDDESLSEPLKLAILDHQAWICLHAEASTTTRDTPDVKSLFARIVAALLDDNTTVVNICVETAPMSVALQTSEFGQKQSTPPNSDESGYGGVGLGRFGHGFWNGS